MAAAAARRRGKNDDSTLGAIVAHPLRSQCLTILADRTASPAELALQLGEELSNVSYHVKQLVKVGAVEQVGERRVRGAVEHFYRAVVKPCVSADEFAALSVDERVAFVRLIFSLVTADATTSLNTETFVSRPDHHLTRVPLRVDEEGWKEMGAAYMELMERVYEIQAASAERLGTKPDDPGIPVNSFLTFFEMPEPPSCPALAGGAT